MANQENLIQYNYSLRHLNTFGIPAVAEAFAAIRKPEEVMAAIRSHQAGHPILLLGGGSNLLLPARVSGLVLYNQIKFIQVENQLHNELIIKVGGGVNWHELVLWSLKQGYGGLENMALIPGTVGAAPVQNIGAYGAELKDVFESLQAINMEDGRVETFEAAACQFGYRQSFFKQAENIGKYFITSVQLRLTQREHQLRTSYGAIQEQLDRKKVRQAEPWDIAAAVIEIRRSKLPDWRQLGNAGSFFKNPVIPKTQFDALEATHANIPSYPAGEGLIKVPAGWLIDQCGWKGKRAGNVGCYEKQALVIVNHGGATGEETLAFSKKVAASVLDKFGIQLEREVNASGIVGG